MKSRRKRRQKAAEFIINERDRRVSLDAHQEYREINNTLPARDILYEAAADPLVDHTPRRSTSNKVNRVLAILDQLDHENTNRRFGT